MTSRQQNATLFSSTSQPCISSASGLKRVCIPEPCPTQHSDGSKLASEDDSGAPASTLPCVDCGLDCEDAKSLLQHRRQQHCRKMPYQCPHSQCGQCFRTPFILAAHTCSYSGKKQFNCSECSSSFGEKDRLLKHVRTHTEQKPYQCSQCFATFNSTRNLVEHVKIHTGEKPYCCSVCNMRFTRKVNLAVHQRTHTGERPYCCSVCSKCFYGKSHLTTHMKIHC